MPKTVDIRVSSMVAEIDFAIEPNTLGKQLFAQVMKTECLMETWFFGIQYTDSKGNIRWLKFNKRVLSHDIQSAVRLQLYLRVKFYPEDITKELIQEITIKHFYFEIKGKILSGEIFCPLDTSIILASYAMQAQYGDHSDEVQAKMAEDIFIPQRVAEENNIATEKVRAQIVKWWKEHKGMPAEDAMMEYLKIAQNLKMFGVRYHEITNDKKLKMFLGVTARGINIYAEDDKLDPRMMFPWSYIRNVSFLDRKFILKPTDRKSPEASFYTKSATSSKEMLYLCMSTHKLFENRKQPESYEILQMRAKATVDRANRNGERMRLQQETAAREATERRHMEYEERISTLQGGMESLRVASDTAAGGDDLPPSYEDLISSGSSSAGAVGYSDIAAYRTRTT